MASGWRVPVCPFVSVIFVSHRKLPAADKSIQIWNVETGAFEKKLEGHTQGISDIAWSSNSLYLCSASDDKTIKIWDFAAVRFLFAMEALVTSLLF